MSEKRPKKLEPADYIIAAGIMGPIVFDGFAWRRGWKTASIRFGEFLIDPKTRLIFTIVWLTVSFHLFWKLPLPFQTYLKKKITGELLK